MNKVDTIFKELIEIFYEYDMHGICWFSSCIFKEILEYNNIKSDVLPGYSKRKKCSVFHFCLKVDDKIYDIGVEVLTRNGYYKGDKPVFTTERPDNVIEPDNEKKLMIQYEKYIETKINPWNTNSIESEFRYIIYLIYEKYMDVKTISHVKRPSATFYFNIKDRNIRILLKTLIKKQFNNITSNRIFINECKKFLKENNIETEIINKNVRYKEVYIYNNLLLVGGILCDLQINLLENLGFPTLDFNIKENDEEVFDCDKFTRFANLVKKK